MLQDHHDKLARHLRNGRWTALAQALEFPALESPRLIHRDARSVWGIAPDLDAPLTLLCLDRSRGLRVVLATSQVDARLQRSTMLDVARKNPSETVLWWWADDDKLCVAMVVETDGRRSLRRLVVDRRAEDPASLELLSTLSIESCTACVTHANALRDHFAEVMDRRRITSEFFKGFKKALTLLNDEMLQGPTDKRERHELALVTLLRLVFLYFLQSRRALDEDPRFIARRFRADRDETFYSAVLKPLFFEALNTPKHVRCDRALELGDVPYLNGGLFDSSPIEERHTDLDWHDDVWEPIIDGLFERFPFVATNLQDEEIHGIDPEMLGRVFEGLMYADQRHRSGSFYTPRDVVRAMVRQTLVAHVANESLSGKVDQILRGLPTPLNIEERGELRERLTDLRILDPAVGTGAFLLEALNALTRLWEAVDGGKLDHVRTRQLIQEHLFGVDILNTATRLCELRFWIALLARTPDDQVDCMPPLPNLSQRIAQGDSLIGPGDLARYRIGDRLDTGWQSTEETRALVREHARAQHRFSVSHGLAKVELREKLEALEIELATHRIQARIQHIDVRIQPLLNLCNSQNLLGEDQQLTPDQTQTLDDLQDERERLVARLDAAQNATRHALEFDYDLRFASVCAEGGFDIIITNPPWVRSERIDKETRHVLKGRYEACGNTLWNHARERGIRAPYGTQVDLANLFLERSLELLKPEGRITALIPAKLFGSLQGTAARRVLARYAIESIEDYSNASRELFDATTYPAILRLRKTAPCNTKTKITTWRGEQKSVFSTDSTRFEDAPWILCDPHISTILERMERSAGSSFLEPGRGIFTGANSVFIDSEDTWIETFGESIKPWLRRIATGRDPRAESELRILWLYTDGNPLPPDDVPAMLRDYFESHRDRLEDRADHRRDLPLWQIYRLNARHNARVVWRDIAPTLETEVLDDHAIAMNTLYQIGLESSEHARKLSAFLESDPVRAWVFAHAEPARGGFRRHFAWTLRLLPLPQNFDTWIHTLDCESNVNTQVAKAYKLDAHHVQVLRGWRIGEQLNACSRAA